MTARLDELHQPRQAKEHFPVLDPPTFVFVETRSRAERDKAQHSLGQPFICLLNNASADSLAALISLVDRRLISEGNA